MNLKERFCSYSDRVWNYNLFIPDEAYYDEEAEDPRVALQQQKYTTRLYIVLLFVCLYILFYATLMKPQARTITISNIDLNKFEKLSSEHGEFLSCPCSTISTSYQSFVLNLIEFDDICSSYFVSQEWIESLYVSDRSSYGVADFRTTATSQVKLFYVKQKTNKICFFLKI